MPELQLGLPEQYGGEREHFDSMKHAFDARTFVSERTILGTIPAFASLFRFVSNRLDAIVSELNVSGLRQICSLFGWVGSGSLFLVY
jgi:hypothetical protein